MSEAASIPTVLFVSERDSGRSQMAAGMLSALAADEVRVLSAASAPADHLDPVTVQAMAEIGVDLAGARPSPVTEEDVRTADVVITFGGGDAGLAQPGTRTEDWPVEDPAGLDLDAVRIIRDDLRWRVNALLQELAPGRV